jgi:hypothetical protein
MFQRSDAQGDFAHLAATRISTVSRGENAFERLSQRSRTAAKSAEQRSQLIRVSVVQQKKSSKTEKGSNSSGSRLSKLASGQPVTAKRFEKVAKAFPSQAYFPDDH